MNSWLVLLSIWYCIVVSNLLGVMAAEHDIERRNDKFPFTTVIDILSHDVQFSTFLRILQREELIPYLNELQNFTLFAPVNSAFTMHDALELFDINNYIIHNNVINTNKLENITQIFSQDKLKCPIAIGESFSNPKNFIINNNIPIVEPDLKPNLQNATVHGISELITDPQPIITLIKDVQSQNDNLMFEKILSLLDKIPGSDSLTLNKTFIIPEDSSFNQHFNTIELNYLLDFYDKYVQMEKTIRKRWLDDMEILLKNLIINNITGGSQYQNNSENDNSNHYSLSKNMNDDNLNFTDIEYGSRLIINDTDYAIPNLSNVPFDYGLAHFFSNIQFLKSNIQFDAEKYLHGLNCSGFVREIYFRDLQSLIQNNKENITIFLPEASKNDEVGFSKSSLLYHFANEHVWLENDFPTLNERETFSNFYNSSFCSSNKRLGGNCQRLKITKTNKGYSINNKFNILNSKPYQISNSLIYTIDNDISLPGDFVLSLPPSLDSCSKSIYFLRKLNLLELKPNHEGYTIFLPCFDSWDKLGLNMDYIKSNITATEMIMKNLIINDLYYTDSNNITLDTSNLLGKNIHFQTITSDIASSNITVTINSMDNPFTIERDSDIVFNQGVIHPISEIQYPKDLNISLKDLIKTTGNEKYFDFLQVFDKFQNIFSRDKPYSILVPSLSSINYEELTSNFTKLNDFLKLHIIPGNETQSLINCEGEINTQLGETLICSEITTGDQYLRIKNGLLNEVRVLNMGCSTDNSNESCVFLINRPIQLDWIEKEKYNLTLPLEAIGLGIVIGVIFIMTFLCGMLFIQTNKQKTANPTDSENSGGTIEHDDTNSDPRRINDDEGQPLLRDVMTTRNTTYDATGVSHDTTPKSLQTGSAAYSSNSSSQPIQMPRTS